MVAQDAIDLVWNDYKVGESFRAEEGAAGGYWTADYFYQELKAGSMVLWLVLEDREKIKAALMIDTTPYPNGLKVATIVMVVGKESRSWIPLIETLKDWAMRSGFEKMDIVGRLAWKKLLPDFRQKYWIYELDLT